MKTKTCILALAAASLSLAGCFTVNEAASPVLGDGVVRHVTSENYGWYLFGCVPLACGNEKLDSWCPFSLFCNEVTPELVYSKLEAVADREGCELVNLHTLADNKVLVAEYYVPIPWLVVYKDVCFSANLVKKGGAQ